MKTDEVAVVQRSKRPFPVWMFALAAGVILGELFLAVLWAWVARL